MTYADFQQRIEEIQLALTNLFESPKAPTINRHDEAETMYLQLSWVVDSHRDTTLDARCVVTLRFARAQLDRYAAMDTRRRHVVLDRLAQLVRSRFTALQDPPQQQGDCAVELAVDDALFDVPDDTYGPY